MTLERALDNTKQRIPQRPDYLGMVLNFAQYNSEIEPWGGNFVRRDRQLVEFSKQEPFLASAINSIAMTRSALSWELSGTPRTVDQVQKLLNGANFGQGWQHLMMQLNIDILTTENGGFIEVIRRPPTQGRNPETMPVEGIAHLPSLQCVRTGNPLEPVIYVDDDGAKHYLKWYQVITIVENPIPESKEGRQFCFVGRVLKFSQIVRDILQHHNEKVSGRFSKAIHVISGVSQGEIEEIETRAAYGADNAGLMRYMQPIILTTLDPNATISKQTIELATLPDGFDLDKIMNWYITLLALASGSDYQEFAPLSSGNLGTASQSDTLHRKSQRKGTQLFIKTVETGLQQSKVIPVTVSFRFKQQDAAAEQEQAEIEATRAKTRQTQIKDGEITPEIARQIAVDKGDLKQEYLIALGEQDLTPNVTISDDETIAEELIALEDHQADKPELPLVNTTNEEPSIRAKWAAANWFTQVLGGHPLQAVSPIGDVHLIAIKEYLRDNLTSGTFGTDEVWMDLPLVRAAQAAGIPPQMLRARLPNNYKVEINSLRVKDNRGSTIWLAPPKHKGIIEDVLAGFRDAFTAQNSSSERIGVMYRFAQKITNDPAEIKAVLEACQTLIKVTASPEVFEFKLRELMLKG